MFVTGVKFSGKRPKFVGKNFANPKWQEEKDKEYETIKPLLARLYKELGDKKFVTGDQVTLADIALFHTVGVFTKLIGDKFTNDFPNFAKFYSNFTAIPEIVEFFNSANFDKNMVMMPPQSVFGV